MASPRRLATPLAILLVATPLTACATRQLARTVGAGRTEFGVLVGGPLQSAVGFTAPVPEHRVHGRVGLTDDFDLSGSVPIGPLTSGVLSIDLGFVAQVARTPGFALATSVRLHGVWDLDDGGAGTYYPELGLHLEQRLDPRVALIGGASGLVQVPSRGQSAAAYLAPYFGLEVIVGEHGLSLALGWINPWADSRSIVRWEPQGHGAITVTFGWRIQPGGVR